MTARTIFDTILAAGALAFIALATGIIGVSAQSQSTIGLIGADAVLAGNTATKLGERDVCVRAEVGAEVPIDIIIDEVPADRPMIGFQMTVAYDPAIVTVSQANHDFLLGAEGQYQPFPGLSDPLPDSDGKYLIQIADLASNAGNVTGANSETGKGVLTRITFSTKAAGRTNVGPFFSGTFDDYPYTVDSANVPVGVDTIADTIISVGQDCPVNIKPEDQVTALPPLSEFFDPGPTPTPSLAPGETAPPTLEPTVTITPSPSPSPSPGTSTPGGLPNAGNGTDTAGVMVAGVLGGVGLALLGGGGYVLVRRRSRASGARE